jgi:hypothetical protein
MKSAYELAMERLSKTAPTKKLTDAQKAEIAEIDSIALARLAQAELAVQAQVAEAEAKADYYEVDEARRRFAIDKAKIEEDRETKRERVRNGQ